MNANLFSIGCLSLLLACAGQLGATDYFHRMPVPDGQGYLLIGSETHDYLMEQFGQWDVRGFYKIENAKSVEWSIHSAVRKDRLVSMEIRVRCPDRPAIRLYTSFTYAGPEGPVDEAVVTQDAPNQISVVFGNPSEYKGRRFSFFVFNTLEEAKKAIRVVSFQPGWSWNASKLP